MKLLNINTNGNKKLINTDKIRFYIWNIPSVVTCPYRTARCEMLCYAKKAEKVYPTCLPSRQRNFEETRQADFVLNMIYTIEKKASGRGSKGKKIVFRIHESGDFYNKAYFVAWVEIARHFEGHPDIDIVFMAYTKSVNYLEGVDIPQNMVVRFSVWDDTKPEQVAKAHELGLPIYTADTPEQVAKAITKKGCVKCDCKDCANCGYCWDKENKAIYCEIH